MQTGQRTKNRLIGKLFSCLASLVGKKKKREPPKPPTLQELHKFIVFQVLEMSARYKVYCQLFSETQERIDLMEDCAPNFFTITHDTLLDDLAMILCRLTDPPTQGDRENPFENLVFERLLAEAGLERGKPESDEFYLLLRTIKKDCQKFRSHRNRRIAHAEVSTALNKAQLPKISKEALKDSVENIILLLKKVDGYLGLVDTEYEDMILEGDGNQIIWLLEQACAHKICRTKQ